MEALGYGVLAAVVCAVLLYTGRRDLAHPAVAFGAVWFFFVAVAQLKLTDYQHDWSLGFAGLVFGGGLLFVAAATAVAGTGRVRPTPLPLARLDGRLLVVIAGVLFAGGLAGLAWKASILDGVPLFSGDVDEVRSRAYEAGGGSRVPAPSTFLTDGFHLALWALLLGCAVRWREWSWARRAMVGLFAAACLVGAFSGGSRNSLLFAVAVPLVVAYLATGPLARRQVLGLGAVALVLLAFASVVFAERISQRGEGETFYAQATDDKPIVVKPAMPAYIAGTYGLETLRRVHEAFPERYTYGYGGYQLTSMPDKAFPDGKPPVGGIFGGLSWDGAGSATWTVASYQGRAYADFGAAGVLLASLLLGVLLGGVYRLAREYRSVPTLVAAACGVYIAAFLVYDNLLSFSVAVVYDLAVVGVAATLATRQPREREDAALAAPAS